MYETAKLRGRIIEMFGSQGNFAKAVKRSEAFISGVLKGKNYLDQRDIDLWSELLEIPKSELGAYFFTHKIHATQN